MFVAASDGWFIRSLTDYDYPIIIVTHKGQMVGVAAGEEGLEKLLDDVLKDRQKKARAWPPKKKLVFDITRVEKGVATVSSIGFGGK